MESEVFHQALSQALDVTFQMMLVYLKETVFHSTNKSTNVKSNVGEGGHAQPPTASVPTVPLAKLLPRLKTLCFLLGEPPRPTSHSDLSNTSHTALHLCEATVVHGNVWRQLCKLECVEYLCESVYESMLLVSEAPP